MEDDKACFNRVGLIQLDYFFNRHGWEATKEKYGLSANVLNYWLGQIGFKFWKSTLDDSKCFYREDPTATVWFGRKKDDDELGSSSDQGRNEYYKFRLARIREKRQLEQAM